MIGIADADAEHLNGNDFPEHKRRSLAWFRQRLEPALGSLLERAAASGEIRAGVSPRELLAAVASLCLPVPDAGADYSRRMVAVPADGLRHGATRAERGRAADR